jgi:hypothetical protein
MDSEPRHVAPMCPAVSSVVLLMISSAWLAGLIRTCCTRMGTCCASCRLLVRSPVKTGPPLLFRSVRARPAYGGSTLRRRNTCIGLYLADALRFYRHRSNLCKILFVLVVTRTRRATVRRYSYWIKLHELRPAPSQ